jgi:hypothetical protein
MGRAGRGACGRDLQSRTREASGLRPPPLGADISAFTRVFDALRCSHGEGNNRHASADPETKTAVVERREASVPRYGTRGAS